MPSRNPLDDAVLDDAVLPETSVQYFDYIE
jgi:hypothetical protein